MDDLLQQGITAYKAGKRDEARNIFITVVKQSPDSEPAWAWMYQISNNDQERIHCLKQIVRINPKNEKANQLLNQLTTFDAPLKHPREQTASPIRSLQSSNKAEKKGLPIWAKISLAIVSLVVGMICLWNLCIAILTISGPLINSEFEKISATSTPSITSVANPTTKSPAVAVTPTAKLNVLPVGSSLTYGNWTILVENVELKQTIGTIGQVNIPKNGRFAVLYLSVTNSGTSSDFFVAPIESAIVDGDYGVFFLDIVLSSTEAFAQNMEEGLQLDPGQTGTTLAVYDISQSSKGYLFSIGDTNTVVLLAIP